MTRGNETDIETGAYTKSSKTKHEITKCSRFIVKVTLLFFIVAIYVGYFMAISPNMIIIGNIWNFGAANVTNSPINGISFR